MKDRSNPHARWERRRARFAWLWARPGIFVVGLACGAVGGRLLGLA